MQIRVACNCGQHYEFEVEPVNGAMPCGVVCPACGADGTQAANQFIAQQSASTTPVPAAPVPIAAPASGGLRISRPAASPAEPEPLTPPAAETAPPPIQKRYTRALEPDREPQKVEPNVVMGLVGGVVAGGISMVGWYFLTLATDREFGFVACIVGAFVGIGVRTLAKDGNQILGFIASVCAAVAILGGNFMVVNHVFNVVEEKFAGLGDAMKSAMAEQKEIARQAVNAKTDEQIKAWLVKNGDLEHEPTPQDIKEFKEKTVPEMQTLLDAKDDGKASKLSKRSEFFSMSGRFKFFKEHLSILHYVFLAFGVAAAWRIGSGSD